MMLQYGKKTNEAISTDRYIDRIQQRGECCGVEGPGDWQRTLW